MGSAAFGSALGRWLRQFPGGEIYAYILAGLVFVALVLYIVLNERLIKQTASAGKFRLMTRHSETGTLHVVHEQATEPTNIATRLGAFDTPGDVYDYVYKKFDEPLFKRVLLYLPGTEPVSFDYEKNQGDDINRENLNRHLTTL